MNNNTLSPEMNDANSIPPEIKAMDARISEYISRLKMTTRPHLQGIQIVDRKGRTAASINLKGEVTRNFAGNQALIGTVGVNEIRRLLAQEAIS